MKYKIIYDQVEGEKRLETPFEHVISVLKRLEKIAEELQIKQGS